MIAATLRAAFRLALTRTARPVPFEARHVLVVAPHPDDETLGCGALIAEAVQRGTTVTLLVLTDGAASHASAADRGDLAARRSAELAAAAGALGVDAHRVVQLTFPDGSLAKHESDLAAAITSHLEPNVDLVLVTSAAEHHPDHAAAGRAAAVAVRTCRRSVSLWEYPIWLWADWPISRRHGRTSVLAAGSLVLHRAARKIAVPRHGSKEAALACYQSQLGGGPADPALPSGVVDRALRGPELYFPVS